MLLFQTKIKLTADFKIGHGVRIKDSVTQPKYDWGGVDHFSRGVITDIIPISDTEAKVRITFYGLNGFKQGNYLSLNKVYDNEHRARSIFLVTYSLSVL